MLDWIIGKIIDGVKAKKNQKKWEELDRIRKERQDKFEESVDKFYNSTIYKNLNHRVHSSVRNYVIDCKKNQEYVHKPHLLIDSYRIRISYLGKEEILNYKALGYDISLSNWDILAIAKAFERDGMFYTYEDIHQSFDVPLWAWGYERYFNDMEAEIEACLFK